jgi:hypothetical protein
MCSISFFRVLHRFDGLDSGVLGQFFVTPVFAHFRMQKILVDGSQFRFEHLA